MYFLLPDCDCMLAINAKPKTSITDLFMIQRSNQLCIKLIKIYKNFLFSIFLS